MQHARRPRVPPIRLLTLASDVVDSDDVHIRCLLLVEQQRGLSTDLLGLWNLLLQPRHLSELLC
jgi:hypothetical protein